MPFKSKLSVTHIINKVHWTLKKSLIYSTPNGAVYRARSGYVTDLYSIPGPLRGVLFRSRKYVEAAVIHDAVCTGELERKVIGGWVPAELTRKEGDALLRDILRDMGAPRTLTALIYRGVRMGSIMARGKITKRSTPQVNRANN